MKNKIKPADLLISILIPQLMGVLGSLFSGNQKEFYSSLILPPLSPPGWVFPVVWFVLYLFMGISSYLVFQSDTDRKSKKIALILYGIQLFLNFLWSVVFFGLNLLGLSVVIIFLLVIFVVLVIISFYKINKTAAYLMIPYLVWILFAAYLNISIFLLN